MTLPISTDAPQLSCSCHRTVIPASEQPQVVHFLIEILPGTEMPRLPLNLAVVLDRSGPIAESCLPGIKQALRDLVEQLTPEDWFSLVSLAGEVAIPAQPVEDAQAIIRLIDRYTAQKEPRLVAGLAEGLKQAAAGQSPDRVSRLMLVIGGETSDEAQLFEASAMEAGEAGIPIVAVGLGSQWSELLVANLTDYSCNAAPGSMASLVEHISSAEEMAPILHDVLESLWVSARNLEVRLALMRGVSLVNLWRVKPVLQNLGQQIERGQVLTIHASDLLQRGNAYLAEVLVPPRVPGQARLAHVEICTSRPGPVIGRGTADLVVQFTPESSGTSPLNTMVMDYVEAAQMYEMTSTALVELDAGNRQAAAQRLRQAAAILISQGRTRLADRIRGEADYNIRQYGQVSSEGRKLILLDSRRIVGLFDN